MEKMKILFVVNAFQKSFDKFSQKPCTNFPWVDAMLDAMIYSGKINCALAVPVGDGIYRIKKVDQITLYGLSFVQMRPNRINLVKRASKETNCNQTLSDLRRSVEDFVPDIIQVFGTENVLGMISYFVDIPVVVHFQGSISTVSEKWFTGISHWEQMKSLTLHKILYRGGVFNEFPLFRAREHGELAIMKKCRFFIGRTSFDRRLIALMSPNARYFHCEEFIRKEFFEVHWNKPLSDTVKCVSILKGVTYKGIDLIFEAAKILRRYTETKVEFIICGVSDSEEVVEILKRRYKSEEFIHSVKFRGKVHSEQLIKELLSSNLYVHPSYMENSSNSICEAMALGMPVIATNVGGTASLIDDGKDGLLVQEGEPYSLAAAINNLILDSSIAYSLGNNARNRAIKRHNTGVLNERMMEIYNCILGDSYQCNNPI